MNLNNKYFPKFFQEIAGQDSIIKTLLNSIKKKAFHNAYLFAGKYGIGKTSTARLLAKAMNCSDFKNDLCGKCPACINSKFDVIEIDAASNRGIDEIREIKHISSLVSWGKYRVYIIDEAHQLTSQASNSFLKLLEQPNLQTKFIFCTTEPWKLLPTIRSRCLPFYFKPIRLYDIKDKLSDILIKEGKEIEDQKLFFKIAEQANNSLRDAINYLELCLNNLTDKIITYEIVEKSLNLIPDKQLYLLFDYLVRKNFKSFFNTLRKVVATGKRYEEIISRLKHQAQEILFVKKGITTGVNKWKVEKIKTFDYSIKSLVNILRVLNKVDGTIHNFYNPKDTTELGFLQLILEK